MLQFVWFLWRIFQINQNQNIFFCIKHSGFDKFSKNIQPEFWIWTRLNYRSHGFDSREITLIYWRRKCTKKLFFYSSIRGLFQKLTPIFMDYRYLCFFRFIIRHSPWVSVSGEKNCIFISIWLFVSIVSEPLKKIFFIFDIEIIKFPTITCNLWKQLTLVQIIDEKSEICKVFARFSLAPRFFKKRGVRRIFFKFRFLKKIFFSWKC